MFFPTPFAIALQFLTILPVGTAAAPEHAATGRSLLYYPLVGLLIGLLLGGLGWLTRGTPTDLQAGMVLAAWVTLTGALHLDGLADSADAWIGGLGDRQRTLSIMKDPYCGPAAVVALILVLLLKYLALAQLFANQHWGIIVLATVLGRTALVLLFRTTPYVRPDGLGYTLSSHMPLRASAVVIISTLVAVLAAQGAMAVWTCVYAGLTYAALRILMLRRIGGTTGDTAGALVEITETVVVIVGAVVAADAL